MKSRALAIFRFSVLIVTHSLSVIDFELSDELSKEFFVSAHATHEASEIESQFGASMS